MRSISRAVSGHCQVAHKQALLKTTARVRVCLGRQPVEAECGLSAVDVLANATLAVQRNDGHVGQRTLQEKWGFDDNPCD